MCEAHFTVAALYCFARFPDFEAYQVPLTEVCNQQGIKGTFLIAAEGINGTVAGSKAGIAAMISFIESIPALRGQNIELKYSTASLMPFNRMKVRLKKEIVTMGVEGIDPLQSVGTYVQAQDWNALIDDKNTILIDTRNDYEYAIGTFKGALDPNTKTFREFPQDKELAHGWTQGNDKLLSVPAPERGLKHKRYRYSLHHAIHIAMQRVHFP